MKLLYEEVSFVTNLWESLKEDSEGRKVFWASVLV